jgi:hypothetical protein
MNFIRGFQGMFNSSPASSRYSTTAPVARSLISTVFPANLRRDFEARQRDG